MQNIQVKNTWTSLFPFKRTGPKTCEGYTKVFTGLWYSSKQAIQGSVLVWLIILFIYSLIIASPEVEHHASSKTASLPHGHTAHREEVQGPRAQLVNSPPFATQAPCMLLRGQSIIPPLCPKRVSVTYSQTALTTRECIFHCSVMKLADFQSCTWCFEFIISLTNILKLTRVYEN